ncbi:O-antigen ligase [Austwickia sp. TVS 96-490-7B]|uniref:O-antigen ligase family protein n=1 Tax=Austwickia sp. TVS 96-490-7B TaxID=2830843 RepID=UPI001C563BC3|nr:O-antigen ligase domain-containing protein [Austwickia sp. TVS 96-490-7B]
MPAWPLLVALGGIPLWWVLGLLPFLPLGYVVIVAVLLVGLPDLSQIRLLPGSGWLGMFVMWIPFSMAMLDSGMRVIGFSMRWGALLAAATVLVHVANCPTLTQRRLLTALVPLWLLLVAGGYLGALIPDGGFTTPMAGVLPSAVLENDLVAEMVRPRFAEVQHPWGAQSAFNRPSAPFIYTNSWGCAFGLLTPMMLALRSHLDHPGWRAAVLVVMAASLYPATMTGNRGMLVMTVSVLATYAVGTLMRGDLRRFGQVAIGGAVLAAGFVALGVPQLIADRSAVSDSAGGRARLYQQTWQVVLNSPILGYGAPRHAEEIGVAMGTQGAFWMYLFSYGIPGVAVFLVFLAGVIVRGIRVVDPSATWLVAAMVGALVGIFFYGLDSVHLLVFASGAALVLTAAADAPPGRVGQDGRAGSTHRPAGVTV